MSKFVVSASGCWIWRGGKFNHGYGAISAGSRRSGRRLLLAHRVVYEHLRRRIPTGMKACHHCDNKLCVNPDHIFIGAQADNVADMIKKGRANWRRGEAHYAVKLTDAQVRALRRAYATGVISQEALGRKYGISQTHVSALVRGQKRKELEAK